MLPERLERGALERCGVERLGPLERRTVDEPGEDRFGAEDRFTDFDFELSCCAGFFLITLRPCFCFASVAEVDFGEVILPVDRLIFSLLLADCCADCRPGL